MGGPGGGSGGFRWKPWDVGAEAGVRWQEGFGHGAFVVLTWAPVVLLDMSVH